MTRKTKSQTRIAPTELERIRESVQQTISRGQAALLRQEAEEARNEREQNEEWVRQAKEVIDRIPEMVRRAVKKGEHKLVLIDMIRGLGWNSEPGWAVPISKLDGWQRIVADACVEMGFTVSVQGQHDGGGRDAWHQLVMTWGH